MADREVTDRAVKLHHALTDLLDRYQHLLKDTGSGPTFGEDEGVTLAQRTLFENRPLADWEPSRVPDAKEIMPAFDLAIAALTGNREGEKR